MKRATYIWLLRVGMTVLWGDELGRDTTGGLDTKSQGVGIDKDDITVSNSLVRVDTLGRLLSEVLLEELLDLGDTSRTTGENDLVDALLLEVCVLENLLDGLHRIIEEVHVELLELGTDESLGEVVTVLERLDLETGGLLAGERTLGLLNLTLQLTESGKILEGVDTGLLLVLLDEVVHDTVVQIFTAKMSVTSSSQDLEDAVIDGKERDIESSPPRS